MRKRLKFFSFLRSGNFTNSINLTRRNFLNKSFCTLTGTLALSATLISCKENQNSNNIEPSDIEGDIDKNIHFPFSISSGDPTHNSVIIWSKLGRDKSDFKNISKKFIPVEWFLYIDNGETVFKQGIHYSDPQLGHSIHVDVEDLESNKYYWYRFKVGNQLSPLGRTKTLPSNKMDIKNFKFNVVSCQHWENGYFNAYDGMVDEEISFILHLGDYIYENNRNGVRTHGTNKKLKTLDDYRERHALYKTDKSLQKAHENFPFIMTLDNHDALYFNNPDPIELSIRKAAYQAWYEFQPARYAPKDSSMIIRRSIDIGSLAQINLLDTRQFKDSEEVCASESDSNFAFGVFQKYCPSVEEYNRYMIGLEQEYWLIDKMINSGRKWNIIASSIMMTQFKMEHNQELYQYLQSWSGYPAERERILNAIEINKISNPICLSGDIHSSLVSYVQKLDTDKTIMPEFVGTSISSLWPEQLAIPMIESLDKNEHVKYFEHMKRGYMHCNLSKDFFNVEMKYIDQIETYGGKVVEKVLFQVKDGSPIIHKLEG